MLAMAAYKCLNEVSLLVDEPRCLVILAVPIQGLSRVLFGSIAHFEDILLQNRDRLLLLIELFMFMGLRCRQLFFAQIQLSFMVLAGVTC